MNHEVKIYYWPGEDGNSPAVFEPGYWIAECKWCRVWGKHVGKNAAVKWQLFEEQQFCVKAGMHCLTNMLEAIL